ncbi:MAG TPA: hypothetical protein GX011_05265 [Clostridiales bacterium]|nr:hypothetical protein [Clostridiales bacterium]
MNKFIKTISLLLTAITLLGSLSWLSVIGVSATSSKEKDEGPTIEEILEGYLTKKYDTPEAKLSTMELRLEKDGYELWVDKQSGEVATVDQATGQILFSNPYDIATSHGSASTKEQIMSQIHVRYIDNDTEKSFFSFVEAAYRGQIKVKNIKNGIRVEYTLGREETRMLVPRLIRRDRFETLIRDVAAAELGEENFTFKKLDAYYSLKDPDELVSDRARAELHAAFPITKRMAVYIFDPTASETEIRKIEEIIKTYCPLYTYEMLDEDHEITEFEGTDRAPALFKMALEYTLDEYGVSVRLPANGIRFDESQYKLEYISILPYMGAGASYSAADKTKTQTGYTFFPDGSGSLFRFEKLAPLPTTTIAGKVYGPDYAYQTLTGSNQEIIRYPAFGIVSNDIISQYVRAEIDGKISLVLQDVMVDNGYLAVIEEGDALTDIYTNHAAQLHKYNYMEMRVYPRPKDSYNMRDAISVGMNTTWTVVSSRKYVGSYKVRYFMLTDDNIAKEKGFTKYYEASWLGMATAYREYLAKTGVLERLSDDDVKPDIPLYIETFGAIETIEKILSIPVSTMVPLTSFEDIRTMYDELSADGISNINFKLTGYANGGMYSSIPYNLKWEKAVGGKDGFEELIGYAEEKDFGVYPDFDFAYAWSGLNGLFDGLSQKQHYAKSIDNRYANRREYSALYQTFTQRFAFSFSMVISPAYFSHFYEKLSDNYKKSGATSISVSTLGSSLNSDFDEKEPYNREDSKFFTIEAFKYLDSNYDSIMTSGGNAYTWKYVDHILDVSLDSSRYVRSSNSVPFIGTVLHGSVQFAGTPLNMEGNIGYAKLRIIENGAAPYFILSYQNQTLLKEDRYFSKYYSVRYDIWHRELVDIYNELNSLLADVQTKLIIDHKFFIGERIPDEDELQADILEEMNRIGKEHADAEAEAEVKAIKAILDARMTAKNNAAKTQELLATAIKAADDAEASITAIEAALLAIPAAEAAIEAAIEAEAEALEAYNAAKAVAEEAKAAYQNALSSGDTNLINTTRDAYTAAAAAETSARAAHTNAQNAIKTAQNNLTAANKNLDDVLKAGTDTVAAAAAAASEAAVLAADARVAASFVNTVESATAQIKQSALDYATQAENAAAEALTYATKAKNNAAAAIAISSDKSVATLINTAKTTAASVDTRVADVAIKYEALQNAIIKSEEAIVAEAEALRIYEEALAVYEAAKAAAALSTATQADKEAATEAGTAMNMAKADYITAQSNATKASNSVNQALTALRISLQRALETKNTVLATADSVAKALSDASDAIALLNTLEGVSDTIKTAATDAYLSAQELSVEVNIFVNAANAKYNEAAELVKDYVVIEEQPADDTPTTPTPTTPDPVPGETESEEYVYTKYTNDNGNIVMVTYGDQDNAGYYLAYKTFVLNYNFFDVTVVIEGVRYTIPASGYVAFYH